MTTSNDTYARIKCWFFKATVKEPLIPIRKRGALPEYSGNAHKPDTYVHTSHLQNIVLS